MDIGHFGDSLPRAPSGGGGREATGSLSSRREDATSSALRTSRGPAPHFSPWLWGFGLRLGSIFTAAALENQNFDSKLVFIWTGPAATPHLRE